MILRRDRAAFNAWSPFPMMSQTSEAASYTCTIAEARTSGIRKDR